ncbi:methyltransferase [Methanosalsum natronophilum]|uniref:Methyltransferase n=1 Tax=Methanosalsum natronophilum TaxID=768733 RepID=A0A424YPX1_9EURY|nr:MAG: methyltransferase [Methanosalsum natronophilum]
MDSQNNELLERIQKEALKNRARVAIGIRNPTSKMISSINLAQKQGYADVLIVGNKKQIEPFAPISSIFDTNDPEQELGKLLAAKKVDAAVRGTANASDTLKVVKSELKIDKLHRIALLVTSSGKFFFLAPVGIDEFGSLADRIEFIVSGTKLIKRFDIEPRVGILSGGRMGDLGRDPVVDRTLADGEFLLNQIRSKGIKAEHYTILIEDAIKESNFIFAPDGISGNLIFRTLVFLGSGDGIGAPILNEEHIFVDTSRVGGHYTKAITLASALVKFT